MNVTWKKVASLLLAGSLLTVAGCSGNNQNASNNSNSNKNGESSESLEPITLTMVTSDANANWDDMQSDVGKAIKEKTGVTLKQEFPVGGTNNDAFAIMAASGDYPDMVMAKASASKLVDAGALIDLTDLIDEYGPNLKKVYGDYFQRLRWSNDDHAIYVLPTGGVNGEYFDAQGGFNIQHKVLKELGYPEVKTVQDYENVLKAYVEKHPTTDDGKPTIPLSLNAGEWQILISTTNPAVFATGGPDDGEWFINQDTYEAQLHYTRPEEKEYFRWLNHMYDIGLLDKESFTQKYDTYKSKIATGRVLGIIDQVWDYAEAEQTLKKDGKYDETYARFPVTLTADVKEAENMGTGYTAGWGVGITTSAKDPVRIIKFLDYLASDEGQVLRNWGIEGKHYNIENGIRVIPADIQDRKINDAAAFQKESGIGNYLIAPGYGDGVKDSTGNYYTTTFPEQVQDNYSEADKETLKAYGITTYKDLWPGKEEFPVRPYGAGFYVSLETGSQADVIYQKAEELMKKRVPEAIMSNPDQFDAIWDAFMKDLDDIGVDKLHKEFTQVVKDKIELWGEQ